MISLAPYLKEYFDLDIKISPIPQKDLAKLPLYLKSSYRINAGKLLDQNAVWAEPLGQERFTPDQMRAHADQIRQFLGSPVVFVLENLESWQRQRLMKKKVSFVQPPKQIYVPEFLLHLSNINRSSSILLGPPPDVLSFPAQLILLYHLQVKSIEHMSFQEIADNLHYSAMSITRAAKELAASGLVRIMGTKEKSLGFIKQGEALWRQSLSILQSPVRETWYSTRIQGEYQPMKAGESALSEYTFLSESAQLVVACGKALFSDLQEKQVFKDINQHDGDVRIEVWYYDPHILAEGDQVDRLSLYLSLRAEDDERIKIALEELIKQMKW